MSSEKEEAELLIINGSKIKYSFHVSLVKEQRTVDCDYKDFGLWLNYAVAVRPESF